MIDNGCTHDGGGRILILDSGFCMFYWCPWRIWEVTSVNKRKLNPEELKLLVEKFNNYFDELQQSNLIIITRKKTLYGKSLL